MASDFAARMAAARAAKAKSAPATTKATAPKKLVPVKKVSSSKGGHGVVKQIELGGSSYPEDAAEPGVATVHVQHARPNSTSAKGESGSRGSLQSRIHMATNEAKAFWPGQKVKVSLTAL